MIYLIFYHHINGIGLNIVHIGMPDFTPPSIDQVKEFIRLVHSAQQENKVGLCQNNLSLL